MLQNSSSPTVANIVTQTLNQKETSFLLFYLSYKVTLPIGICFQKKHLLDPLERVLQGKMKSNLLKTEIYFDNHWLIV